MRAQTKLIAVGILLMIGLSAAIAMIVFDDVEGPYIYEVDILPVDPAPGDMISVTIYCIDRSGVSGATLHSRIGDGEWEDYEMHFLACLCIAGGRWVAQFGPVPANTTVQVYVTAYDNAPIPNSADTQVFEMYISE